MRRARKRLTFILKKENQADIGHHESSDQWRNDNVAPLP